MAADPWPQHRLRFRGGSRPAHGAAHRRRQGRRWIRPLVHAVVAPSCLLVVVLVAAGRPGLATSLFGAALACALLHLRTERRLHEQRRAADPRVEHVLELVWEDWVQAGAARGTSAMDRWRRTHRP